MTKAEYEFETIKHIESVRKYLDICMMELLKRGSEHDGLKLKSPEAEIFIEYTPKLAESEYGSDEYKKNLEQMKIALDHHYENYRHHPEHFENGINDMNLIDIIEMFCDWKAATLRHENGNLLKSIEINSNRFKYDEQLKQIFINTAKLFENK